MSVILSDLMDMKVRTGSLDIQYRSYYMKYNMNHVSCVIWCESYHYFRRIIGIKYYGSHFIWFIWWNCVSNWFEIFSKALFLCFSYRYRIQKVDNNSRLSIVYWARHEKSNPYLDILNQLNWKLFLVPNFLRFSKIEESKISFDQTSKP